MINTFCRSLSKKVTLFIKQNLVSISGDTKSDIAFYLFNLFIRLHYVYYVFKGKTIQGETSLSLSEPEVISCYSIKTFCVPLNKNKINIML